MRLQLISIDKLATFDYYLCMVRLENFKVTCGQEVQPLIRVADNQAPFRFHIHFPESDTNEEISVSEFADEADITPQAVRKMIAEGRLQAKRLGNQYVLSKKDLYKYLQE
jgi:excisionase family DNA binding protein